MGGSHIERPSNLLLGVVCYLICLIKFYREHSSKFKKEKEVARVCRAGVIPQTRALASSGGIWRGYLILARILIMLCMLVMFLCFVCNDIISILVI